MKEFTKKTMEGENIDPDNFFDFAKNSVLFFAISLWYWIFKLS